MVMMVPLMIMSELYYMVLGVQEYINVMMPGRGNCSDGKKLEIRRRDLKHQHLDLRVGVDYYRHILGLPTLYFFYSGIRTDVVHASTGT